MEKTSAEKCRNKGPPGLKNPGIMKFVGFGPSHNETEILLDQTKVIQIIPRSFETYYLNMFSIKTAPEIQKKHA